MKEERKSVPWSLISRLGDAVLRCLPLAAVLCWAGVLCLGGWVLSRHVWSAGIAAPPASAWPEDATPRVGGRPTLVVFIHPRCPCSRVTLSELAWVLARSPGPVAVRILLVVPDGAPP